ncbi:PKD domain-containing protein [Granulicella sp. S190]|uniref:PKD domain-containing protein n=1 Tax=Granulicella sp. S190 TaxID=1747226 RepID=UPI00131B7A2E|nr:PKD domain-containing protein [Granulicella sp. S190]
MKQTSLPLIFGLYLAAAFLPAFAVVAPGSQNSSLEVTANAADGRYTVSRSGSTSPVLRAAAAIKVNGKWLHASDYPKHAVSTADTTGELGPAKMTTVRYTGRNDAPDLLLKLRTYSGVPFGDIQLTASNTLSHPVDIQSLRVLEIQKDANTTKDIVGLGAPATADRVLSDSFSEDRPGMQLRDIANVENNVHRAVGVQLLYNQQSKESWFIGALTSDKFLSVLRLHMSAKGAMDSYEVDSTGTTELLRENSLLDSPEKDRVELSLPLAPAAELSSERMLFSVSNDYHNQLETYAHLVRDLHHARVTAPTPIGWWSWTAYYFGLNHGAALSNAQWLSQHLKSFGYTFFHMDEGYQYARGEYAIPDAALFPQGIGALEHEVMHEGLTPGIWTAPFEVSERSWIYTHHPEWLVHNGQGEPIHIGFVTEGLDHLYALDTTHPGAQAYLRDTYSTLVHRWGIRYIKMDFMEDSAIEGFYHVPQTTALEAQRIGIQTIRDAVGPDVLLDKDGCELLNPVGLVDMGRISQDTGHTFSASKDAAPGIAARYYINRNYYLADPDAFSVSAQTVDDQSWHGGSKPLTLDEAKVSIALSAISGGLFEEGDDLPTLGEDADRVRLVEDRDLLDMARLGRASTPVDLMSYETADIEPSIFLLKQTSRQSIVTVFNWSETSRHHSLTRGMLGLDEKGDYTVTELLEKEVKPTLLSGIIEVQQPLHSVRLFKIVNNGVPVQPPTVTASVPTSATAGDTIAFSAEQRNENNAALRYTWDFGDGITTEGARTTHTYTHAGVYAAHLTAEGFSPELSRKDFSITVTGSISTKFVPQNKRRFVEVQP